MKKYIVLTFLFFSIIGTMVAQGPKYDRSKINEIKEAYFIQQLKLSKSETEKFWKLYQQYDAERHTLRKAGKKSGEKKKFSEMSDTEIYNFIDYYLEMKQKELDLQKKYLIEFKKLLPAEKVVKLLFIEEQFRQYLFKQAQEKK